MFPLMSTSIKLLYIFITVLDLCDSSSFSLQDTTEVSSLLGTSVHLGCNITAKVKDDQATLVLWYRTPNATGVPFYTVDLRIRPPEHFVTGDFKERAWFNLNSTSDAILNIANVTESDTGWFSCRVDFKWSRTSSSNFLLNVIVPPQGMYIKDTHGQPVYAIGGPYDEDNLLNLTCVVENGRPPPRVVWYLDDTVIDDTSQIRDNSVENELIISRLSARYYQSVLTCQATNRQYQSVPISTSIRIDMHLKPKSASIVKTMVNRESLTSGRKVEFSCITNGSRPAARISWALGSKELTRTRTTHSTDGNSTWSTSSVFIVLTDDDDGQQLKCRAENPRVNHDHSVQDIMQLSVRHKPQVSLRLQNADHGLTIKGKQVTFLCTIKANPPLLSNVTWHSNGRPIREQDHLKMGLTVKNTSLTIKSADPEKHGGHYYCGAKNSVGSSISNTVTMNVSYAPSCTSTHGQPNVYQVPLGGAVDVTCHVTASPVSDVRYKWTFEPLRHSSPVSSSGSPSSSSVFVFGQHHGQNTKESRQRNANAVGVNNVNSSNGLSDTLHFRLNSTSHYGLLSCWPSNIIGNSSEPCEFIIARPPGPPRAPSNCGIENRTDGHLFVQCSELQGDPGSNLDMLADRSYFGSLGSRTFSEASSSAVTYHLDIYKMSSGQAGHGGSNVASLIASFANVQRPVFEVTADQLVQIRTDKTGKGNKLEPSEASNMSFVIYASNKQHGNSSTVQMTFELSVPKFLDPSLELFKKDTREEMSLNQVSNYSSNLSASIPSIIESKPVILVISVISVTMTLFVVILVTQVTKLSRQREARKTATEGNGEKEEEEENKRKMRRNSISPKFTTLSSSRITKVRTSPLGPLDSSNVTGIDHECSHHQSSVSSEHLLLRDPRKVLSLTGSPRDDFDHSSNLNSSKALDCSKTDLLSFQLDNVLTSPDIIQLTSNAMHVLIVKPRLEYYHDDGDDNILETGFNEKKSPHSFANAGETLDSTSTNYNSETTPQDPTSIPPDHVTYRVFSVSTPV